MCATDHPKEEKIMESKKEVLGQVQLSKENHQGINKEGKPYNFDTYHINLGGQDIQVLPSNADKNLFEYLVSRIFAKK